MLRMMTVMLLVALTFGCNSVVLPLTPAARSIKACQDVVAAMDAMDCFDQQEVDEQQTMCDSLADEYTDPDFQACDVSAVLQCMEEELSCDDVGNEPFICLLLLDPDDIEKCPGFFTSQP